MACFNTACKCSFRGCLLKLFKTNSRAEAEAYKALRALVQGVRLGLRSFRLRVMAPKGNGGAKAKKKAKDDDKKKAKNDDKKAKDDDKKAKKKAKDDDKKARDDDEKAKDNDNKARADDEKAKHDDQKAKDDDKEAKDNDKKSRKETDDDWEKFLQKVEEEPEKSSGSALRYILSYVVPR